MADYRPMPRGAYDANGRPIGRWPEPPEPVAPQQDLLPTPAPAPAPVQRTSPGGVGWMPNNQERDMMQDLYPESTQRPPTRLEKFFQWLSGSSDAGADTLYPSGVVPANAGTGLLSQTMPGRASGYDPNLGYDPSISIGDQIAQQGAKDKWRAQQAATAGQPAPAPLGSMPPINDQLRVAGEDVAQGARDFAIGTGKLAGAASDVLWNMPVEGARGVFGSDATNARQMRLMGVTPPRAQPSIPAAGDYPDHFYVPSGGIGAAAPSITAPPSTEIAIPYGGGTYYRDDSQGVPVLSNVQGGTSRTAFNSAPAYAMGATLAAQRPDIYNPDGTPRQTTFGGQAVDPGLADTVATVSQITKDMQALNPRGGPPRIVGEEDPFDAAIRSVRSSGLSKNTQAKYIADITQQRANASQAAARDATSLAVARIGADSANARLAAEDKREDDRLDLGRAKLAADVAGRGRVTTEEVPVVFRQITGTPTPENRSGITHTAIQGRYAGQGATPEEASRALRLNIQTEINRYFDDAMRRPDEKAALEAEFKTTDPQKLREEYMLRAYRQRTTRQRTTQPTTGIGGTSLEE